ncbi:MAG: dephospho-CoA kinase, partial [Gammaproteobacteria bacterium]|nr:dephospho-CoA kinase [Gammaproteobacteria bacterium]
IRQQLFSQSEQQTADYCILAIPLLIEAHMGDLVDHILVIDIDPELQLQRLCERDNLSLHNAQMVLNNQCTRQQRLSIAHDIIINNGSPELLAQFVEDLHNKYCELAKSSASSCQHNDSHGQ